jgi:hypothetical protein
MLPAEDLFVHVYVLVDDAVSSRAVAIAPGRVRRQPAPAPSCWSQSEASRRIRWLPGRG